MMVLTDAQYETLRTMAAKLEPDKRDLLLQRTAAILKFRSRSDSDFREAVTLASVGLVQADGFVIPE